MCNTDLDIPDGIYVDMEGRCPAYNQVEQIQKRIDDLRELEVVPYNSGELASSIAKDTALQATPFSPILKYISAIFKLFFTALFALTAIGKERAANNGNKNLFTKKGANCPLF